MFFRGREFMHKELGLRILDRLILDLGQYGKPEKSPSFEGQIMMVVMMPASEKEKVSAKEEEANKGA